MQNGSFKITNILCKLKCGTCSEYLAGCSCWNVLQTNKHTVGTEYPQVYRIPIGIPIGILYLCQQLTTVEWWCLFGRFGSSISTQCNSRQRIHHRMRCFPLATHVDGCLTDGDSIPSLHAINAPSFNPRFISEWANSPFRAAPTG